MIHHSVLFSTTVVQIATQRVEATWSWYVIRAAGFVAAGLLFLLMISGIGMVTGLTYRFFEPAKAWVVHKALGLALAVSVLLHVGFLLIDKYLPFSIPQAFIPFVSNYKSTKILGIGLGSLYVALGILAFYAIAIVILSSLGWIDTKKKLWKKLHYLNYFIVVAVFFHALKTGSDLSYGIFRNFWILAGIVMLAAILTRLWRSGTISRKK